MLPRALALASALALALAAAGAAMPAAPGPGPGVQMCDPVGELLAALTGLPGCSACEVLLGPLGFACPA